MKVGVTTTRSLANKMRFYFVCLCVFLAPSLCVFYIISSHVPPKVSSAPPPLTPPLTPPLDEEKKVGLPTSQERTIRAEQLQVVICLVMAKRAFDGTGEYSAPPSILLDLNSLFNRTIFSITTQVDEEYPDGCEIQFWEDSG